MIKSSKGFTLVELIVVIAILAILAGVAIPVYNGYIQRAQDAAAVTELDAIATAAQAANATEAAITGITVNTTNDTVTVTGTLADNFDKDFLLFYGNANATEADTSDANDGVFKIDLGLDNTSYKNGTAWTAAAGWSK